VASTGLQHRAIVLNVLDDLRALTEAAIAPDLNVEYVPGRSDVAKRSAWASVEGSVAGGRLTVWESGEGELEVFDFAGSTVAMKHAEFLAGDNLAQWFAYFVGLCRGTSPSEPG
jgi:hypothetical protein